MKKLIVFLVVALLSVGMTVSAYAQNEQPGADIGSRSNPNANTDVFGGELVDDVFVDDVLPGADVGSQSDPNANKDVLGGELVDDVLPEADAGSKDNPNANAGGSDELVDDVLALIDNPYEYWEKNGYPANISFAAEIGSANENGINTVFWEIGIINADEASKQAILDLLAPNNSITFVDCTYSHSQRETAYNAILAMKDGNILDVVFIRNTEKIQVVVSEDSVGKYTETLVAQFGNMIWVTDKSGQGYDDLFPNGTAGKKSFDLWIWTFGAILLIGTAAILFANRTRLIPAFQTNNGNVVTGSAPASTKQTVAAIKNSALTPSDDVFKNIMEKVNNTKK